MAGPVRTASSEFEGVAFPMSGPAVPRSSSGAGDPGVPNSLPDTARLFNMDEPFVTGVTGSWQSVNAG